MKDISYINDEILTQLQLSEKRSAEINALIRAYKVLEIKVSIDGLLGCQYKISTAVGQDQIVNCVDFAYEDHIAILKLSSRPEFYTQKENVTFEIGIYFLSDERLKYADLQVTRLPSLQTGRGKYDGESPRDYEERVYGDIISRPAFYFLGWNRKTRTFGNRFWRSEFDLDEIFRTFIHVFREIKDSVKHDSWYANTLACHVPTPCPFLPIRRTGIISDEIYEKRNDIQNILI